MKRLLLMLLITGLFGCKKKDPPKIETQSVRIYCNVIAIPSNKGCYSRIAMNDIPSGERYKAVVDITDDQHITIDGKFVYNVNSCFTHLISINGQIAYKYDPPDSYKIHIIAEYGHNDYMAYNDSNKLIHNIDFTVLK